MFLVYLLHLFFLFLGFSILFHMALEVALKTKLESSKQFCDI